MGYFAISVESDIEKDDVSFFSGSFSDAQS
jgi:hypothetical protein